MVKGSATKTLVSAFGALAGMAGIEHGIGEILQGNVAPGRMMILAWPGSEPFRILGGEPAMTIVPNLLATGILAVMFSLIYAYWAYTFAGRKHGWPVLVGLALAILVSGGGFGTALLGLLTGLAASQVNAPQGRWSLNSGNAQRFLGMAWPWAMGASLVAWLSLLLGTVVFEYIFGTDPADPVIGLAICSLIVSALVLFLLAAFTGFIRDSWRQAEAVQRSSTKRAAPA